MVGMGMIFDDTYRPCFEVLKREGLYDRRFGLCEIELAAAASRTGQRQTHAQAMSAAAFGTPTAIGQIWL